MLVTNDMINGGFEIGAALFSFLNVLALRQDQEVKGVSLISAWFFIMFGAWNLYYYPSIGQPWSFAGGVVLFAVNSTWMAMVMFYSWRKKCTQ